MKTRPKNRGKKFSGTTLRLEQRIINGQGRSQVEKRKLAKISF